MEIRDILPGNSLSDYIKCYRVVHIIPTKDIPSFSKYYVPKPEMVLHTIVKGSQQIRPSVQSATELSYRSFVSGQQIQPFVFSCQGEVLNFQIVFKPTALYKLTGIPTCEIAGKFVDAQLIFGNLINTYLDQLENAGSINAMVKTAEAFILQLLVKATISESRIDRVFKKKLTDISNITVNTLAKENNLCEKQFKRNFIQIIGVNPKMYLNIVRFHKAYNIRNANPDWDWLRIAVESGYYDYQHLTKEYLLFTNHTPVQYHQQIEPNSPEMLLGVAKQIYHQRFKELALL
jgi:AraC-like DNA-binding protein